MSTTQNPAPGAPAAAKHPAFHDKLKAEWDKIFHVHVAKPTSAQLAAKAKVDAALKEIAEPTPTSHTGQ